WEKRVVEVALADLEKLLPDPALRCATVLDAGCGQGKALKPLQQRFRAMRVIGVDVDAHALTAARAEAARHGLRPEFIEADCAAIPLPDASVDLVFCHQ